ncbi:LysR substrate-binding domain-containing protein [Xylophilus sp. ASV27]|uniref:LysR substrate-binding domain-containing protein n=1 Tax=Xylophilus sp. ASV27 TaxID=2795129 RepID=UPI0018EB31E5
MDFAALEIFSTVAAEGNVTRAAERLQRAQSNVSTRLQQLEEELGATLFLREGRRMALTPAGQSLLDYAGRLLALAEEARQAVRPDQPGGRLRLGAMESTAASRLPGPLARLHGRWPEVVLELSTAPSRQLVERIRSHALDCALLAWPPPGLGEDASDLEVTPFFREALLLALPAGHPDVAGPDDLQVDTLAAFATGCTYRRIGETWMTRAGAPPRILELASYHAILACVAAGRCAGVVPRSLLELMREPPPLRLVPLQSCDIVLVQRRGYRSAALDALRELLASS